MNIKRLFILTGTALLGLTLVSMWMLFLSAPPELARAAGPWYVAPSGSDSNSCLSTSAPCDTINGAIGKATGGDTIFVATGTYTGTGDEVVLIDKDITLSGGWDDTFTTQSGTSIIDGEDARRGITVSSGVTATVDYFTVQRGGAGIYNMGTLTLMNSTVSNSYESLDFPDAGAGITNSGTLTITNSIVTNNSSYQTTGGIYNSDNLTLINSTVSSNFSDDSGGGIYSTNGSSNIVIDSQIYGNLGYRGGGVILGGDLIMSNSWVVGNETWDINGGGVGFINGSAYIENSIVAGNFADGPGGGLYFKGGGPYQIVNSHIIGNESDEGAAMVGENVQVALTNTLIISNTGTTGIDSIVDTDAVFLLNYCDTYGNSPDGTVGLTITRTNCLGTPPEDGLDPMMAGGALPSGVGPDYADEWLSYDYHLLPGSPAIDAGTPEDAPATDIEGTPRDATPDIGAYEGGVPFAITGITPNSAVVNSGNLPVTISGFNLSDPISAQLNGVPLLNLNVVSNSTLTAVVPVNSLEVGAHDLIVTIDSEIYTLNNAFIVGTVGPWYVATSGDDEDDCLSPATPCATINGTLNKPGFLAGSTVLVATGTYDSTGDEVVLIDKDITLSGGWDASFTTQSGTSTIDGEESRRGITVNSIVNATVDYFSVQNGYADSGGGIHNSGTLTLTKNTIRDSFAYSYDYDDGGGGIHNIGTLTVIKSTVKNNRASQDGGGIYGTNGSSTVIIDSQIYGNWARGDGGGISFDDSDLIMSNSWVVGNETRDDDGGGVALGNTSEFSTSSAYIENSIIAGNFADVSGGGLAIFGDGPYQIVNSNIIGNKNNTDYGGAAMTGFRMQVALTNTLIISNSGKTGISGGEAEYLLNYCDTYGNSPDGTVASITRTNCLGTPPEDGLDPMMAGGALPSGVGPDYADEWLNYDYRLLAGSPAIDAGIDAGVTRDIDNQPRPYQTPDIGAYEYWPPGVLKFIYLPLVMK